MPYFFYTIRDKDGKMVDGQRYAATRDELVHALRKEGQMVVSCRESRIMEEKYKRKFHKKVTTKDLGVFAKEMSVLIENAIPLAEALEIIVKQLDSTDLVKTVEMVKKDVESGLSLHESLGKHQKAFGGFWADMVEAGELSGQLSYVLQEVVRFLETREDLRKKVIAALTYPVLLICVIFMALAIFMLKIVPIFDNVFKQFGSELPPLTKAIVTVSNYLRGHYVIIGLIIGGIIYTVFRYNRTKNGKRALETVLYRMPVIGNIMVALSVEKFTSTLAVLLKSGIPIIRALDMSVKAAGSVLFIERVGDASNRVSAGAPLAESLQETGLFPALA
ncbi:MAG: type II secretion system F family protein, partial [Candidatus Omnitrophica bacterium]|nr:type II secretion system F family protein [Candidatus Omnitrophota bacterium]